MNVAASPVSPGDPLAYSRLCNRKHPAQCAFLVGVIWTAASRNWLYRWQGQLAPIYLVCISPFFHTPHRSLALLFSYATINACLQFLPFPFGPSFPFHPRQVCPHLSVLLQVAVCPHCDFSSIPVVHAMAALSALCEGVCPHTDSYRDCM